MTMKYYSRRLIKHEDLNPANRLFGGRVLEWIDEEAGIYAACQLKTTRIVTKFMSEINFVDSAHLGEVVEFGLEVTGVGKSSITIQCTVRNKATKQTIIQIERIVFVSMSEKGRPCSHGIKMDIAA